MVGKVSTRGLVTALAALAVASGVSLKIAHARPNSWAVSIAEDVPAAFGSWTGQNVVVPDEDKAILGTDTVIQRNFTNARTGDGVSFLAVYAEGHRRAFHPPEYCLTGAGLKLDAITLGEVEIGGHPLRYNRMVFVKGGQRLLVLNWYVADDLSTADFKQQQLNLLISMLRGGGRGAMMSVSYIMRGSEGEADVVVQGFMKELLPLLPRYLWPEGGRATVARAGGTGGARVRAGD